MPDKIKFSSMALDILADRYLWKDARGFLKETPEQMLHRVAKCVASVEKSQTNRNYYEAEFYQMMSKLDFLPNSPTLMNAGRDAPHNQLAACFVIGIEDSMESICAALRKQMLIHKTGGGTGFNFSKLRAKDSIVNSTNGRASGPVSFMRLFDLSTDVIQQGGMRRGANMAILNADHPDIEEFISCKDKDGIIENFNLSVGVTDAFMQAAMSKPFSREAHILEEIAAHAWRSGDPGVVFLDALNKNNPLPSLGPIEATNPCGESPLLANEACNLGSINLANFVLPDGEFDFDRLTAVIWFAVRFLDNVIDAGQYPLPEIERAVKSTRKIGLGIMGWADVLYKMHIVYGSEESFTLAETIMRHLQREAHFASRALGIEKGIPQVCRDNNVTMRNATVTCIAPTGTLALLADCSSGIEPVFDLSYIRFVVKTDGSKEDWRVLHKAYAELVDDNTVDDATIERVCVTAHDIPYPLHVKMQAIFQKHTDLAVSKTVNMAHTATVDDVLDTYITAWTNGCKGVTVYRDGSKGAQVLAFSEKGGLPEPKCSTC